MTQTMMRALRQEPVVLKSREPIVPEKICEHCKKVMRKSVRISNKQWAVRRFCNRTCAARNQRRKGNKFWRTR